MTLAQLLGNAPDDKIAIILPERDIRVSYGALRRPTRRSTTP